MARAADPVTAHYLNSFGAKFQTTFVVCFFILTDYRLERHSYVKLKDWMSNSLDLDETAHWSFIWVYAVCKSLLLSPLAVAVCALPNSTMVEFTLVCSSVSIWFWLSVCSLSHLCFFMVLGGECIWVFIHSRVMEPIRGQREKERQTDR